MMTWRGHGVVGWMVVGLVAAASSFASERSELLTAKGEVAYAQGRADEAVRLLEQAVAVDPDDSLAQNSLGQVLLALGRRDEAVTAFGRALALDPTLRAAQIGMQRARGEVSPASGFSAVGGTVGELGRLPSLQNDWTTKPWGFSVTTGFEYDSNVRVLPGGQAAAALGDPDKNDVAWVAAFGAQYNLVERSNFLLRGEYDIYQNLHLDISDFDFRAQQPRLTASYGVTPSLWVGTQGGYNYYSLGEDTYQGEPYVMPFVSYLEGTWGMTQLLYRWGQNTFFSAPFTGVRSGPDQTVNVNQTFYLPQSRYLTVGYQWYNENPNESTCSQGLPCPAFGNDWQFSSNQAYLGVGSPIPFGAYVDFLYLFRSDDYKYPSSYATPKFSKARQDYGNYLYVGITRPITEHIAFAVTYYGTFNPSNIPLFQYNRNVVSTLLQVTY